MHFSRTTFLPALATLLCQPFVAAQEETTTASSPLTVTTTDPMVARAFHRMFDEGATFEIAEDRALVMSLDDGGKLVSREGAPSGWLTIEARPAALMRTFKQQVTQGRMMAGMMGGMAFGQMGIDSADVDDIFDALFEFPNQIDKVRVTLPKKVEKGSPIDIDIDVTPLLESWLGNLVSSLRQHPAGLRRLPPAGAMMTMDADVDFQAVMPLIAPVMNKLSKMFIPDDDLRAAADELYPKYYKGLAGPMSATFDTRSGMRVLMELSDSEAITTVMSDPRWVEMTTAATEASGVASAKLEPAAVTHRGIPMLRTTIEYDESMGANPFIPNGNAVGFSGVAGNAMVVTAMNQSDAEAKSLIDAVLDEKVKRAPLPNSNLVSVGIDLVKLIDVMSDAMGGGPDGDVPDRADVNIRKLNKDLHIEVRIK